MPQLFADVSPALHLRLGSDCGFAVARTQQDHDREGHRDGIAISARPGGSGVGGGGVPALSLPLPLPLPIDAPSRRFSSPAFLRAASPGFGPGSGSGLPPCCWHELDTMSASDAGLWTMLSNFSMPHFLSGARLRRSKR